MYSFETLSAYIACHCSKRVWKYYPPKWLSIEISPFLFCRKLRCIARPASNQSWSSGFWLCRHNCKRCAVGGERRWSGDLFRTFEEVHQHFLRSMPFRIKQLLCACGCLLFLMLLTTWSGDSHTSRPQERWVWICLIVLWNNTLRKLRASIAIFDTGPITCP